MLQQSPFRLQLRSAKAEMVEESVHLHDALTQAD